MLYIIDSAHIDLIKKCAEFYPIDGVTTNPTIIAKEKADFKELICGIREILGPKRALHVQTTAETAEAIAQMKKTAIK